MSKEEAIRKFNDPKWRINNLYHIIDKQGLKIKFKLNWAQEELYHNMWYCNVVLKARQLGISTFICLLFLDRCLFNPGKSAGIIAHTREDAEYLFKRIKFAYDSMHDSFKAIRPSTNDSARELVFNNGSSIRVGTSMRGSTLQYLHISEFGKICAKFPDKAEEIITGSLNTVAPGQYIFIESTAEGREGPFYDICKSAQDMKKAGHELSKLDYRFHFFSWVGDSNYRSASILPVPPDLIEYFESLKVRGIHIDDDQKNWYIAKYATQGENMRREYPTTEDDAWEMSTEGTYYAKNISLARSEGRISNVKHDETLPVYTAWDLGYNDSTCIIYFQVFGKELRIIDYTEGDGESLAHWIGVVKSKPYVYEKHLAPHDIEVHELSTGMTRLLFARKLGLTLIPIPKTEILMGIDLVRASLSRCWFDEIKCSQLIKCLDNYKKEWDDRNVCWRKSPLHNWASHGCFTGDTLVLTRFGHLPIMLIEKDMEILTLEGWKKCNKAIVTKKDAKLVEVRLCDGMNVRCTPDHLFLTEKGWISAENLEKGFKIQTSLIQYINELYILDVIELNEKEDVYCINVPEVHHFSLANGAVVHNSDAMRTLACGLNIVNQKYNADEERQRSIQYQNSRFSSRF